MTLPVMVASDAGVTYLRPPYLRTCWVNDCDTENDDSPTGLCAECSAQLWKYTNA